MAYIKHRPFDGCIPWALKFTSDRRIYHKLCHKEFPKLIWTEEIERKILGVSNNLVRLHF